MSHLLCLSTNSARNIECLMALHRGVFRFPDVGKGGFGMGYYDEGELLLKREPREEGHALDLTRTLSGISSNIVLAHSRSATVGQVRNANTHPFVFGNWMFAHNGTYENFPHYREKLLESMPPYIRRGVKGDTDSEHLFHLILAFLYDAGTIGSVDAGPEVIRAATNQGVEMMDNMAIGEGGTPPDLSLLISDGYSAVAMTRGIPLHYTLVEGISNCEHCRPSRTPSSEDSPENHDGLKAVIVRSGCEGANCRALELLPDNRFLTISRNQRVEFPTIG